MHHGMQWGILGSLLGLLTACAPASQHGLPSPQLVPIARPGGALEIGISTKQDVYTQFGQPSNVRYAQGTARWIYLAVMPATHMTLLFPVTARINGDNLMETHALILHFSYGILRRHVSLHHSYDRTIWGGLQHDMRQAPQVEEFHVREEMAKLGLVFDATAWESTSRTMHMWPVSTPAPVEPAQ